MKAIVCTDLDFGILFNHRRVSQDIKQREDLFQLIQNQPLVMDAATAKLYGDHPQIKIVDDLRVSVNDDQFCVFENDMINQYQEKIDTLIHYNWNRKYPSDCKLKLDLSKYIIKEQVEFGGKSHEKITRTIYVKKD